MKYAIVNGIKTEAQKGLKGVCPICGETVIAKCGDIKINHWAHKSKQNCDKWWEKETEWHRKWKNYFPEEWQEVVCFDNINKEKHIADIKTPDGLVIEFQHSPISYEEKESREKFYKNIIWVFDKTRLKYDYKNFLKCELRILNNPQNIPLYLSRNGMENSKVPVFFDFSGLEDINDYDNPKFYIYCILPVTLDHFPIITKMSKQTFIDMVQNNTILNYLKNLESHIYKVNNGLRRLSVINNCSINSGLSLKFLQLFIENLPIYVLNEKSDSEKELQSMVESFERWVNERMSQNS